ncbi:MAG: NAD-dependent epimerase/dehydratase family protein [Rhizorhabdus sp.]
MRVAVTGSAGKIGHEACAALKAAGHRVIGLDLRAATIGGVRTAAVDCTDFGAVMGALSGIDTMFGMCRCPSSPMRSSIWSASRRRGWPTTRISST